MAPAKEDVHQMNKTVYALEVGMGARPRNFRSPYTCAHSLPPRCHPIPIPSSVSVPSSISVQ
jgi:hypothetical protein